MVLKWSTGLFGNWAGTTALGLFSLNPNIIAYTSVFMMDIGFAAFSTLAFYSLWKYFIKPSRKNLAVSAVAFSMMQLTKHTAILLFGVYPIIFFVHWFLNDKLNKKHKLSKKQYVLSYLDFDYLGLMGAITFMCIPMYQS